MLFRTSFFAKIARPVTFFCVTYNAIFLTNDVDTQLILEFKNSFRKYHPVFSKNPYSAFFGTPCTFYIYIMRKDLHFCTFYVVDV